MSASYRHLALEDVKPGMVLYEILLDPQGQVLLPKGATLSASVIALLPRHGVESLAVEFDDPAVPHDAATCAAIEVAHMQRIAYLFRQYDPNDSKDWATALLRHYVEQFHLSPPEAP